MPLDPATVRRIAKLARIGLEEAEVAPLQQDLNAILGWIQQLDAVDVSGVAPLTGAAAMALRLRDDQVTEGDNAERLLANAPERAGEFFAVPKVVE